MTTPARWRLDTHPRVAYLSVLVDEANGPRRDIHTNFGRIVVREHNALVRMIEGEAMWAEEYEAIAREALGLEPLAEDSW